MAGRSATQLQLSAHRYQTRRLERALRCGQLGGGPAPGRAGLVLGCLLTVIAVAGAVVAAVVRPQPGLGDAPIVLDRASGALYVRVGDVVHPVLNLASARLIAGATDPRPVTGDAIGRARRGPPVGIPGAPGVLGEALAATAAWSLCEDPAGTTLVAGADPAPMAGLDDEAIAVSSESAITYLLLRGRRMPINPADPMLDPAGPRRVSGLWLNAIPEAPPAAPSDSVGRLADLPATVTLCAHWRPADPAG
ncbi:type VII secretion protein EccB, partial [Mycolicibacter senuensis]|uniref:type VII secretion protein EccB n=1 Tax=Mycolicibacter senuensis TaxID=386913 RepID=UPI000DCE465E